MNKMTSLKTVTEMNERLCEAGKKGLGPRNGKTERDHKSGAHARSIANKVERGNWENECGGNQSAKPHPADKKSGGKRNPPSNFKAPRKGGKRKRN